MKTFNMGLVAGLLFNVAASAAAQTTDRQILELIKEPAATPVSLTEDDRLQKSAEICFYKRMLVAASGFMKKQQKMSRNYGTYDNAKVRNVSWKADEAEGRMDEALAELKDSHMKPMACSNSTIKHLVYCMDADDADAKCP